MSDADVLRDYITDGPNVLSDVSEPPTQVQTYLNEADSVTRYVNALKSRMEADLNNLFSDFHKWVDEQLRNLEVRR